VAARIAGQQGLEQLTIVGLAREAGVSRQLVYDHFSDLSGLVAAMLMHHFASVDEAVAQSIALDSNPDPLATPLEAARRFLGLSREDRHILRSLIAHTDAPRHELSALAIEMRERSIDRWSALLGARDDLGTRARIWALVHSLHGLGDLVSTEVLTVDQALAEFATLFEAGLKAPLMDGRKLVGRTPAKSQVPAKSQATAKSQVPAKARTPAKGRPAREARTAAPARG
jgi:AcrR family transcriptional regulator